MTVTKASKLDVGLHGSGSRFRNLLLLSHLKVSSEFTSTFSNEHQHGQNTLSRQDQDRSIILRWIQERPLWGIGWPQLEFSGTALADRADGEDANAYSICGIGAGPAGGNSSGQQINSKLGVADKTDGLDATHGEADPSPPRRDSRNQENFTSK